MAPTAAGGGYAESFATAKPAARTGTGPGYADVSALPIDPLHPWSLIQAMRSNFAALASIMTSREFIMIILHACGAGLVSG